MNRRRLGLLAFLATVLGVVANVGPGWLLQSWTAAGVVASVPVAVGSTGQTIAIYASVASTVGPLATVLLGLALGYYAGRHLDFPGEYRPFARAVGAGSVLGVVALALLAFAAVPGPVDVTTVLLWGLAVVRWAVAVSLVVTVSAFAAAAFVGFGGGDADAGGTVVADEDGRGEPTADAPAD